MMDLSELKFRKEKPDAYAGMLNQAHKRPFSPGVSTVATTIIAREEEILTSVTATAVEVGAGCVNERSTYHFPDNVTLLPHISDFFLLKQVLLVI